MNITQLGSTHSGKYRIIGTTEDRTATSILTLNQLRINDSGIIECIAMVTVFKEGSHDAIPVVFTNLTATSLSVLGKYFAEVGVMYISHHDSNVLSVHMYIFLIVTGIEKIFPGNIAILHTDISACI